MKMAVFNEVLYLDDVSEEELKTVRSLPARYDKSRKCYAAKMSIDVLHKLKEVTGLSKTVNSIYENLCRIQQLVNEERTKDKPEPIVEYPVKYKLFEHQVRGANMALLQLALTEETKNILPKWKIGNGFGFLFEMGCGKTLTTIAVLGVGYHQEKIKKVLIAAPSSVCSVWTKEFEEYADFDFTVKILLGAKEKRLKELKELDKPTARGLKVAVINYESIWRLQEEMAAWQPDAIVCDESQRIKTHNSSQSKGLHELGKGAKYKLILSGTPVQNSPLDVFSQYKFLDASVFGENFYTFKSRHAVMGGYGSKQVISYQNLDELTAKTHSIAYRVTKEEALDLPEQTYETRHILFTSDEKSLYEKVRENSLVELSKESTITSNSILTKLLRLQQITGGFLKTDENTIKQVSKGKLAAVQDILEDYVIDAGKKLVIFARFIPEIEAIRKLLEKKEIHYAAIWGDVKLADRGEEVRRFQEDTDVMVFVAQIQTAGLGITLTAANAAVYYSVDFNYANYSQSLARIHRIGQKNACTYIHLVVPDTIDSLVLEALEAKKDIAKTVVDDWKKYF